MQRQCKYLFQIKNRSGKSNLLQKNKQIAVKYNLIKTQIHKYFCKVSCSQRRKNNHNYLNKRGEILLQKLQQLRTIKTNFNLTDLLKTHPIKECKNISTSESQLAAITKSGTSVQIIQFFFLTRPTTKRKKNINILFYLM